MEQEKKTVDWLLSELADLEYSFGELEYAMSNVREKLNRYDAALEALTGMCYDEHVQKSLMKALKDKEGEGA
jgi:hypothetical protein